MIFFWFQATLSCHQLVLTSVATEQQSLRITMCALWFLVVFVGLSLEMRRTCKAAGSW